MLLEAPLNEYRLIQAWKDVVGPAITKYTSNLYIKNQILYVHLTSSVLRQELMMGRDLLVKNLNKQVGAQVIVNIIFRLTGWSSAVSLVSPKFPAILLVRCGF